MTLRSNVMETEEVYHRQGFRERVESLDTNCQMCKFYENFTFVFISIEVLSKDQNFTALATLRQCHKFQ